MLKEALRRLFWLGPTLVAVTVPTFWALARTTDPRDPAGPSARPLFFNPEPRGPREQAQAAVAEVAANGPAAPAAARRLVELGGAALPHVLPQLDAMSPDARGRVAWALVPLAQRMGVAAPGELATPEEAVLFWSRYWEEHSVDFRPAIVRRVVRRLAERPAALRRSEVLGLDTFALEDLVREMRPIDSDADLPRVRQLSTVAARVTGRPWLLQETSSVRDGRRIVEQWERFWATHRADYAALTGAQRLVEPLRDTRYGEWVERIVFHGVGAADDAGGVRETLVRRGPVTLVVLAGGVLGGYLAGIGLAVVRRLRRSRATTYLLAVGVAVLASATAVTVTGALSSVLGTALGALGAALAVAVVVAATVYRHHDVLLGQAIEAPHTRTAVAFGASRLRVLLHASRESVGATLAHAVASLPLLVTTAFVAERAFALDGLATATVVAVDTGNHAFLMVFALLGTLTLGVAQIAADILLRALDPRAARGGA